ncbi:MAG: M23 family metallopeptidase [Bacteroidota bacterium]
MIVYCLLITTLLLAALSLLLLWPRRRGLQSWRIVALALSVGAFIYLYGTWLFLSVYARYALAAALLVLLAVRIIRKPVITKHKRWRGANVLINATTLFFLALSVLYYTGTNGAPPGVADIAFPFKNGNYIIFQGGNGLPTNLFHYNLRKAVYAIDIVKLNGSGNRATTIFSNSLNDYTTYNDTVYSPIDGKIVATETTNPDNPPGVIKRGPKNTNYVLVKGGEFRVLLAHFRPGTLLVTEGQQVAKGQPVGLVGNSGFSLEPHLHIQVNALSPNEDAWYHTPQLQIKFNGRNYLLFETIAADR